mmetsp:Transcript_8110/g.18194  ORF Transcript_8110/g.18194 Transcript_8110/m.18194 type:complete len:224 (+) Transcript_8110:162-833(+)
MTQRTKQCWLEAAVVRALRIFFFYQTPRCLFCLSHNVRIPFLFGECALTAAAAHRALAAVALGHAATKGKGTLEAPTKRARAGDVVCLGRFVVVGTAALVVVLGATFHRDGRRKGAHSARRTLINGRGRVFGSGELDSSTKRVVVFLVVDGSGGSGLFSFVLRNRTGLTTKGVAKRRSGREMIEQWLQIQQSSHGPEFVLVVLRKLLGIGKRAEEKVVQNDLE